MTGPLWLIIQVRHLNIASLNFMNMIMSGSSCYGFMYRCCQATPALCLPPMLLLYNARAVSANVVFRQQLGPTIKMNSGNINFKANQPILQKRWVLRVKMNSISFVLKCIFLLQSVPFKIIYLWEISLSDCKEIGYRVNHYLSLGSCHFRCLKRKEI